MSDKPKPVYDDALITSDVCKQCGWCCHSRFKADTGFNLKQPEARKFIKLNLIDHDAVSFKGWDLENNTVSFSLKCSQLKSAEDGSVFCQVYEDRPMVCRTYNCLTQANERGYKHGPDFKPREVIRRLYGKEIELENKDATD